MTCLVLVVVERSRPEISVKELCREMSSPTDESWSRIIRAFRYLKGRPRAVIRFHCQDVPTYLDVVADAIGLCVGRPAEARWAEA